MRLCLETFLVTLKEHHRSLILDHSALTVFISHSTESFKGELILLAEEI